MRPIAKVNDIELLLREAEAIKADLAGDDIESCDPALILRRQMNYAKLEVINSHLGRIFNGVGRSHLRAAA